MSLPFAQRRTVTLNLQSRGHDSFDCWIAPAVMLPVSTNDDYSMIGVVLTLTVHDRHDDDDHGDEAKSTPS